MDAYSDTSDLKRKPSHNTVLNRLYEYANAPNVAELLKEEELGKIGHKVVEEFQIDWNSNEEWRETAVKSMEIALQVKQAKNYPFAGASNVKWPLVTVAALQFNARAYPAIVDSDGIVKAKVLGEDQGVPEMDQAGQPVVNPQTGEPAWKVPPGAKAEKATRIAEHMSYQLLNELENWEEDTDTLLIRLPIVGTEFRKVYRGSDENCSELVPALDLVVNKNTKSFKKAPRVTHILKLYPYEVQERQLDGRWLDVDIPSAQEGSGDVDAPIEFLEQHRRIDLDGDKYPEPYIVTVHKDSEKVVRIVANFSEPDIKSNEKKILRIDPKEYFVKYGFIRDPRGGFYDIGFGFLLQDIGDAINTTFNQMLDAGHLQNAGGGFIGSGLRLKKSQLQMAPGVYHTVDAPGGKIRDSIVAMEHPGPSNVLFSLLGMMISAAQDITAVKDILTGGGESEKNQTATTTLALIEQGMKVFTAIYKRIYRSLSKEFKLLFRLNAEFLDDKSYFTLLDTPKAIARADYNEQEYDVCPVADPDSVTDMQRLGKAQFLLQNFLNDPLTNQIELRKRVWRAAKIEDADSLLQEPQPNPMQDAAAKAQLENIAADTEEKQAKAGKATVEGVAKVAEIERAGIAQEMDAAGMLLGEQRADADRAASANQKAAA